MMDINRLKRSLDIIFKDAPDGEVSGAVYGYHDQVEIYPDIILDGDQLESLEKLGWMPTDCEEGLMFFT